MLQQIEGGLEHLSSVNYHLLLLYLDKFVLLIDLLSLLFEELLHEVDASVHVYGSDEGHQLEEQLTSLEGEQEGTVPEYLLQGIRNASSNDVVRILDVLDDVQIQLMMMEQVGVHLAQRHLQVEVCEPSIFHDILSLTRQGINEELDSLRADEVGVMAQEVQYFQYLQRLFH